MKYFQTDKAESCRFSASNQQAPSLLIALWLLFPIRLVKIKEWVDSHDPGALVIPFSGNLESKLQDMSEEERHKYCTEQKTQRLISIQSPFTLLSAVSYALL